ncbi:hypothetical protein HDV01_003514 [Terramyces sp. JEL0728]|nr:hypothetical protein HDV01_003514 [Terramyces sp. JEL0728]
MTTTTAELTNHVNGHTESKDIRNQIASLGFSQCKVYVSNVDAQPSMAGGVIIQVLGELSNNGETSHKFSQTFFLAEQPEGYYVLNDIFRFLKEDIDGDYDPEEGSTEVFHYQDKVAPSPVKPVTHIQQKPVKKEEPAEKKPVIAPMAAPAAETKPANAKPQAVAKTVEVKPKPAAETPAPVATPAPVTQAAVPAQRPTSPQKRPATTGTATPWSKVVATETKPQPAATQKSVSAPAAPAKAVKAEEKSADGFQDVPSRKPANSDRRNNQVEDREKYTVYIKSVPENIDRKALHDVFAQVGPVAHVDVPPGKHIAFVQFVSQEDCAKAIGNTFVVNGESLLAEERRKPNFSKRDFRPNSTSYPRSGNQQRPKGGFPKKDKPAA